MKLKKILLILLTLLIILTSLSGCYDSRNIEDLAYATALGLDISPNNSLLLTVQISIPSSSSESGSSQSSKTDSITVECSSINSGISLINSHVSKELNLSHCKVIVFSEKLAEKGISEYVDTLKNNIEIRSDCNVIISKNDASDFIKNSSPSFETLTARYYEVALSSPKYTGYTTSTELIDFFGNMKNDFIQASAILGGINQSTEDTNTTSLNPDNAYIASKTPIKKSEAIETFGTAVFKGDKLVGELTGIETLCHLLVTNDLNRCTISVQNPFDINSTIDLYVHKKHNTKINLSFINGTPYIDIEVFLEGYGLTLNENIDYSSPESLEKINKSAEQYLKTELENYLYKTSKIYRSDIAGFGKYALSKYLTIDEWNNSNWLENYKNSFFNIHVNVNIKSGYEFNNSP